MRYEGEYKDDKRQGTVEELSAVRDSDGERVKFVGRLDENQMMVGLGRLEAGKVCYSGEF